MLSGIDISNYQKNVNYSKYDFVIIKASEGRTMKDKSLDRHYNAIKNKNILYGFYHYAHPELNAMKDEAKHFLSLVGHHAGKAIFALDWEGKALRHSAAVALQWLDYVYEHTGVRPLFYTSASNCAKYAEIYKRDYGLWVAHYGVKKPKFSGWPYYAIWQFTDKPLDRDYFNGDKRAWLRYAAKVY